MPSEPLEALGGDAHQLRNGGEIPVSVRHLGVAEIGRERQNLAIDIGAVLVPAQEPAHGEAVAQVVDARSACASPSGPTQSLPEPAEGLFHSCERESGCALSPEEELRSRSTAALLTVRGVASQGQCRRGVKWDQSGLAELACPDGQGAVDEVDVADCEGAGLRDPEFGG